MHFKYCTYGCNDTFVNNVLLNICEAYWMLSLLNLNLLYLFYKVERLCFRNVFWEFLFCFYKYSQIYTLKTEMLERKKIQHSARHIVHLFLVYLAFQKYSTVVYSLFVLQQFFLAIPSVYSFETYVIVRNVKGIHYNMYKYTNGL